jgi:fumarylacetoacetase
LTQPIRFGMSLNETHDAAIRRWVRSATNSDADFPIQNLSPVAFRPRGQGAFRIGAAIGDQIG